jgi:hypothetical protein
MLKKMLIHGLIAAAVIGGAAAVYASGRGDGYAVDNAAPTVRVDAGHPETANNGYIADDAGKRFFRRGHDDKHERKHERYGERSEHHRKHGERDDD